MSFVSSDCVEVIIGNTNIGNVTETHPRGSMGVLLPGLLNYHEYVSKRVTLT